MENATPLSPAEKSKLFPIAVTVIVLICLLVVMVMTVKQRSGTATKPQISTVPPSATPTIIPRPILGSMTMKTKDGLSRYQAGKPVIIIIQASSEGKHIVAYDAILGYDSKGFSYQSSSTLSKEFQLYPFDRKTYVSFSGIRSLQSAGGDTWIDYPLIEVVMVPKKAGNYTFVLSPQGKEVSKLADDNNQITYPKTTELHLEIY